MRDSLTTVQLLLHNKCPVEMESCDRACVSSAATAALGASTGTGTGSTLVDDVTKCQDGPAMLATVCITGVLYRHLGDVSSLAIRQCLRFIRCVSS